MTLATPFTSGAEAQGIELPRDYKMVLRVEALDTVLVYVKVGSPVSADAADYYLQGGEAIEVKSREATVVNVLAGTGTPKIFWRVEPLTPWN